MKITTYLGAALLCSSAAVYADNAQSWLAVFGEYNNPDNNKLVDQTSLADGYGIGLEYVIPVSQDWSMRVEYSHLDITGYSPSDGDTGHRFGVDALYFLNNKRLYAFAGVKQQSLGESYQMLDIGLGKHWDLGDNLQLVTEYATYLDPGEELIDFGIKLGLAYHFGTAPKAPPPPSTGLRSGLDRAVKDGDNDGIIDSLDQCPNSPMGASVDATGCPLDSDGDGVIDDMDKCMDTPKDDKVNAVGCSIMAEKVVTQELKILFAHNSDVIRNPDDPSIVAFAEFMQRYPGTSATINGHASAVGDADYNMALSLRRATATMKLLIDKYGIAPKRLSAKGYGETRLLDPANTLEAHKRNRRIEAEVRATKTVHLKR